MEVDESVAAGYQRSHREIELERAFESACEQEWVKNAEVNDVLHRMMITFGRADFGIGQPSQVF